MSEELQRLLAAIRASRAPSGVATRVVAVDGPGGAGKSSLARWLASALDAPVVHTDDFASWDNPTEWWPQLLERALKPLAAGRPARYRPTSWGAEERDEIEIAPAPFVIVEGVTASRDAFRPYLAYAVWVETPRDLRLRRGLERDGEDARPLWEEWMAAEDAYVARERPRDRADCVLRGDTGLWM